MFMMAICALLWSTGGIFIKLISWSPLLIAGARSLISAGVLGAYMAYTKTPIKVCKYSIGAGILQRRQMLLYYNILHRYLF